MAENTKIEWCDHTFNPWVGCTKISRACDHCYAEGWAKRSGSVQWCGERRRTSAANWRMPLKWNAQAEREGRRYHVFCASLADVFDNQVPPEWREDLFRLIEATPHLDWLLLTKRIGNAEKMMFLARGGHLPLLPNLWLGITICNQKEADRDIPELLKAPAAIRFLSIEPLLGPILLDGTDDHVEALAGWWRHVDWVICGGESGPGARPMHPDWARSLRDQCAADGVPFMFKQWGEWLPAAVGRDDRYAGGRYIDSHKGGRVALLIRSALATARTAARPMEVGETTNSYHLFDERWASERIGRTAAGRLLDGVEHNGFPSCP